MFDVLEQLLASGRAAIVEANFTPAAAPRFERLPPHRPLLVFCTAPRELVIERYAARRRHDGHLDDVVLDELRAGRHEEQWQRLPLDGEVVELEIDGADLDALVARVREALSAGSERPAPALE